MSHANQSYWLTGPLNDETEADEITITIVPETACPSCGNSRGNRPKVGLSNGNWAWRCYALGCTQGLYEVES